MTEPTTASAHPGVQQYARHVNPAFVKLLGLLRYGRALVKARDIWIWDHEGRKYLDALASYGAVNIGHNHPRLLARLQRHLGDDALNFVHVGPSVHAGALARRLTELAGEPLEIAWFTSSGAEAVEAGMRLARAATRRRGFLYCQGGYHGTSLGTLSIMGHDRLRRPFEPLLRDCRAVPFGDIGALRQALRPRRAAALVIDPGLCEAGVRFAPAGYLAEAQELCRRHGTLLILDEIQTGLGRTGELFAYHSESVVPDILILAKSLSGGIAPIGATLTSAAIHDRAFGRMDRCDMQFSTFGGNSFSCVAALETLDIIADQGLVANSRERGREILDGLRARLGSHPLVRDIRGRGLLIAIELDAAGSSWRRRLTPAALARPASSALGQWMTVKLLERQIICQSSTQQWNLLKLMPPLTIDPDSGRELVAGVAAVLDEYRTMSAVLRDAAGRLGEQFLAGWKF
jgi:putrescine aminotransferase